VAILTIETVDLMDCSARDKVAACEPLHRKLRPEMDQPYARHMMSLLSGGAQLAIGHDGDEIRCLAFFRVFGTTLGGKRLYVDDLVTDPEHRGRSYGAQMLAWVEVAAKSQGCIMATLESGVQRGDAHRFYFCNGYVITAFSFEKAL
jgi:GNAT superfamily N-acetyltransferase